VRVPLPISGNGVSRSIDPDITENYVNIYEAVFQDQSDKSVYFRGTATASQGYISVPAQVGRNYAVLVLAGYNRTLLGGGYTHADIKPNIANTVTVTLYPFPPQWNSYGANTDLGTIDETLVNQMARPSSGGAMTPTESTNDFVFDASIKKYETATPALPDLKVVTDNNERYVQVAPVVTPYGEYGNPKLDGEDISVIDTFTVHFNIAKFVPLIFVDPTYNSTDDRRGLTLAGSNVRLVFQNMDDPVHDVYLPPVEIAPKTGTDDVEKELDVVVDATDKRIVITDIHGDSVISFKNTPDMNDINTWLPT
jgi:hypothetical protein